MKVQFLLSIFVLNLLKSVISLHCIQCDRRAAWYSPSENQRLTQLCQKGEIAPTKCEEPRHTHCIYSYYRQGDSPHVTVTERRCGREEEIVGCTLFKTSQRKLRHLLGGSTSTPARAASTHRRRETTTLFVELCTEGCEGEACINASSLTAPSVLCLLLSVVLAFSSLLYR